MRNPIVALIVPLGEGGLGAVDPGFGVGGWNRPSQPIYHPGHPDHGRPVDPGYGQGGRPHPGNRPPGSGRPNHPDNALPEGEEIQIDNELPPVPPQYEDKTIVAIKRPDEEWVFRAYDPVQVDNALPPSPEPK